MDHEQAVDAALLAFLESGTGVSLRDRVRTAVAAHMSALQRCPTCEGTRHLVVRSERAVWTIDPARGQVAAQPVAPGQSIPCVACEGAGSDRRHVSWLCTMGYGQCRPEPRQEEEGHDDCGWSLRLPGPNSGAL